MLKEYLSLGNECGEAKTLTQLNKNVGNIENGEGGVELFALQVRVSFQTCYPSIPDICPVNEVGQPEESQRRQDVNIQLPQDTTSELVVVVLLQCLSRRHFSDFVVQAGITS